MAKRPGPSADELTKRILQCNHAHRPHEYFGWLVARQLARFAAAQLLTCLCVTATTLGELVVLHGNSLLCNHEMRLIVHATCRDLSPTNIVPALHTGRLDAIRASAAGRNRQMELFDTDFPPA